MPEVEMRKNYPMLSASHWWTLRKKFRQSIPGVVSDSYLATVLDMGEPSARANVSAPLRTLGLVSQDGKPTELVNRWRDDEEYGKACEEIRANVYPQELLHSIPDPQAQRDRTERWFQNKTGVGTDAARKMAVIYTVIAQGDISKEPSGERKAVPPRKATVKVPTRTSNGNGASGKAGEHSATLAKQDYSPVSDGMGRKVGPEVNINLQVHISADASSDQIDQIFASMAKHLYKQ